MILEEKLPENAAKQGEYLMKRLNELKDEYEEIGDVRGKGLMVGVEFVKSKETKEPNKKFREKVIEEAFKRGLILLGAGTSSLRLQPPLVIREDHVDTAVEILEEAIRSART